MPQIKDYRQRVESPSGISGARMDVSAAGAAGRGLQIAGQGLSDVTKTLYEVQTTKEISTAAAQLSELNLKYNKKLQSLSDSGSLDIESLNKEFDEEVSVLSSSYSTNGAANYISRAVPQLKVSMNSDAIQVQREISKVTFVQNSEKSLSNYEQSVRMNPSSLDVARQQLRETISAMPGDAVLKAKILQQGDQRINVAQIDGIIAKTPDEYLPQLMKDLEAGGVYDDRGFSNETRKELIGSVRREISIREADKNLTESKIKEANQKRDEATQSKILLDITSGENKLSNHDIAKMMADPDKAMSMINWKSSFGKKYSASQSKSLMSEAYQRINLPDSDPKKIFSFEQLRPYTESMEPKEAAWLAGQLQKAPAEKQNIALRNQFFTAAKTAMGIDPLSRIQDPKKDELFASFMIEFEDEFSKKRSEGISPRELLDPKSKNSMYPMIQEYRRSLNERLADQTAGLKGGTKARPKKPDGSEYTVSEWRALSEEEKNKARTK